MGAGLSEWSYLDAPDACSSVEVEEPAEVAACPLLHIKVEVQVHALRGKEGEARGGGREEGVKQTVTPEGMVGC